MFLGLKKHFLFITNLLPPAYDGVGDHTFFLAKSLHSVGHKISMITRQDPIADEVSLFAQTYYVEDWRGQVNKEKVLAFVLRARPDWVVVQYVPYAFDRIGLPFFLPGLVQQISKHGDPVAVWFHEIAIRYQFSFKYAAIAFGQRWIAYHLASRAKSVITSIDLYAGMLWRHREKLALIPSGANLDIEGCSRATTCFIREEIAPGADQLIVVFGKRDIRFFLPVFRQLQSEFPRLGLLLIGGHFRKQLSDPLPSGIFVHSYVPAQNLCSLLSLADIGFLPDPVNEKGQGGTSNKSGSLAALFAAGLPVIGVKGDMNNRLLEHGTNIWLVDTRVATSIFERFKAVLESRSIREKFSKKGKAFYKQYLDWEVLANRLDQILG